MVNEADAYGSAVGDLSTDGCRYLLPSTKKKEMPMKLTAVR